MKQFSYAAIFTPEEDPEWNCITIPDIFGAVTCGKGDEDSFYMAKDLLRMMLLECPAQCRPPKSLETVRNNFPGERVELITVSVPDDAYIVEMFANYSEE